MGIFKDGLRSSLSFSHTSVIIHLHRNSQEIFSKMGEFMRNQKSLFYYLVILELLSALTLSSVLEFQLLGVLMICTVAGTLMTRLPYFLTWCSH